MCVLEPPLGNLRHPYKLAQMRLQICDRPISKSSGVYSRSDSSRMAEKWPVIAVPHISMQKSMQKTPRGRDFVARLSYLKDII